MKKEIYIFSGLGADESVFQKLDFSGFETTFIKWIIPNENETIENYTSRILKQIKTTKPILIGLSFGGIIAVEVAKQIETEKVIIIASAKTKNEIPFYFRFAGQLGLHKLIPTQILKSANFITNWFFGTNSKFEEQLLKEILINTNPTFLKWAIDKIVKWDNLIQPKDILHIHGTNDKILPLYFVNCNLKIKKGGHLMTLNKSVEINKILNQKIKN
ncbi:alpha/beta hydrolase [Myroides sp. JBRI-B21084]|uniref:alpha/beta hydrolase n=1 Tax=Myroides sp. JBRI-B21084 TaxID=3119977 RepID=UPI0026E33C94|nr:alpha/beta hydrolase [Paenimyroides cloacae]WKW46668.1 alpha/beta hydrolase [Paenimyroides cloacae]